MQTDSELIRNDPRVAAAVAARQAVSDPALTEKIVAAELHAKTTAILASDPTLDWHTAAARALAVDAHLRRSFVVVARRW